jgi:hypothetical protein
LVDAITLAVSAFNLVLNGGFWYNGRSSFKAHENSGG